MQQNGQTPKTMLDQKQNWLVSGAYLSHIFRLERHRNHHVETHAQTHSHIQNAKLQPSCSRKMLNINARHAMHVMQCTTNMDSPKEMLDQKQNWLVSGAYLSHIFRLERHRNHHVKTHAQTHSHIQNAKLQPSCSRKILNLKGFGFFASVTGVFCYSGLVRGFFATVGVGGFLRQCWGGFFATVERVVVFCDGNRGLLHRRRSTAERGLVRWFFATVGVGGFLRQCWEGFLRQWKGFWLRQGGFFASVVVFCDGSRGLLRRRRSTAERSIKKTSSWATVKQW